MKFCAFLFAFSLFPLFLFSQTDPLDSYFDDTNQDTSSDDLLDMDNLDSLLDNPEDVEEPDSEDQTESVLSVLLDTTSLTLTAGFELSLGYTSEIPTFSSDNWENSDSLIWKMSSSMGFNFQLSNRVRIKQTWSIEYPNFALSLSEFSMDYQVLDFLALKAGQYTLNWGISKNFEHTNIINRLPEGYSGSTTPLSFRFNIPIKAGGLELLALTRRGYWDGANNPGMDDFGWGFRLNLPILPLDFNLSFFAHPDLSVRTALSVNTTLFKRIETYGELMVSIDPDGEETVLASGKIDNPDDISINLGLYTDFFNQKLSIGAEYFYNGEESELVSIDSDWNLYYGTNLAAYISWTQNDIKIYSYGRYSEYTDSGVIGPAVDWDINDIWTLHVGGGWVWGSEGYGAAADNPDPLGRKLMAYVYLDFADSWKGVIK